MSNMYKNVVLTPISLSELEDRIRQILQECITERGLYQGNDDLLTPTEIQDFLDISHTTRIDWTNQGILQAYSLGGRKKYYKKSEVCDALKKIERY